MIELSKDTRDIIAFAVKYCNLVDIAGLMIVNNGIRAKQDATGVYLIEPGDFSFLEFDLLYTPRVKALFPRFKMFETSKIDYKVSADIKTLEDGSNVVRQLVIEGGKTKVSFDTAMLMKNSSNWPHQMKDPSYYSLKMNSNDLQILGRGISAMGAEDFKLYSKDGKVQCRIKDIERDVLEQEISDSYEILNDDADEEFDLSYNYKIISPLLKEAGKDAEEFEVKLTRKGIMLLKINGLSMYIFPELD